MLPKKLLIGAVLALALSSVQARDKVYAETPADNGMASQMLENWSRGEGVVLRWEASYDIELAYSVGKSSTPVKVRAPSVQVAMQRFVEALNRKRDALEIARTDDILLPPPLFACYFAKNKTFVVREDGQLPCDGPAPSDSAGL